MNGRTKIVFEEKKDSFPHNRVFHVNVDLQNFIWLSHFMENVAFPFLKDGAMRTEGQAS